MPTENLFPGRVSHVELAKGKKAGEKKPAVSFFSTKRGFIEGPTTQHKDKAFFGKPPVTETNKSSGSHSSLEQTIYFYKGSYKQKVVRQKYLWFLTL